MSWSRERRSEVAIHDLDTGETNVVVSSGLRLEAPNWSTDGESLILNADGALYSLRLLDGSIEPLTFRGLPWVNNDHVVAPDGKTLYSSTEAGRIYALGLADMTTVRAISSPATPDRRRYLHGVSRDGGTLVYTLLAGGGSGVSTRLATMPAGGAGAETILTDDDGGLDDGPEFSPDGAWIYFNSERASPGHAQLYRMPANGGTAEQLTFDERVNWFPHPLPNGGGVLHLSYPPGTTGHPADRDVVLRLLADDGTTADLVRLHGGQGTINVPSWHPDGRRFAFVSYNGGAAG